MFFKLMELADYVVILRKLMQTKEIAILNSAKQGFISLRMLNAKDVRNIKD